MTPQQKLSRLNSVIRWIQREAERPGLNKSWKMAMHVAHKRLTKAMTDDEQPSTLPKETTP